MNIMNLQNQVLFSFDGDIKTVIQEAVKQHAYLRGANLSGVDLSYADLCNASLSYANLSNANLYNANLCNANLSSAYLSNANLSNANLSNAYLHKAILHGVKLDNKTTLPTKETWKQYLEEVVPSLLKAGGKTIMEILPAWDCHTWENCPMALAFDIGSLEQAPVLLRPRIKQFIQLFDARLIPKPNVY